MGSKTNKSIIVLLSFFTILFCIVIAFDFFPFLRGPAPYPPEWQWDYLFVNTLHKIWMPLLVMGALLFFAFSLERTSETYIKNHEKKILLTCIILFFVLQLSVTFFSRAGIGVLLQRIANPDMNGYFTAANTIDDISPFLRDFNSEVLSLPMHAQGHPPGAILFFWSIEQLVRPFSSFFTILNAVTIAHGDVAILWNSLTLSQKITALFSALFIPFLSSLSCIVVYYIGKFLYGVRVGVRTVFLLTTIPSLILFIPINDVFLPIFPLTSFLYFIKGINENKTSFLLFSGFIFSFGLFFSLSILPLLFIFGVYLCWRNNMQKILRDGIFFSSGLLLLPLLLFFLYGYNTITVSQTLLTGLPESRVYTTWVFFNLSDFFIFLGIPLFIIFCFMVFQLVRNSIRAKLKQLDPLVIGFIGMLLLLDISGTVRGEVARIWIPFYPFLVIILAMWLTKKMKLSKNVFIVILLLQFLQVVSMQEFWVMLW